MATGKASDFQVYNDQFMGAFIEQEVQFSALFNEASRGAIVNVSEAHKGDYVQESFFTNIDNLVSRRDTTSVSAATALILAQAEMASVKLNRKVGPIDQTLDAFRKILAERGEGGDASLDFLIGTQIAKSMQIERLDRALKAVVASMTADVANVEYDAAGAITTAALTQGLQLMGDASNRVVCWVMHSDSYWTLVREQIAAKITNVADVNVHTGVPATLNRPVIVTDSAELANDDSPTGKLVLGLTAGAVVTMDTEAGEFFRDRITGNENVIVRLQGEYAYNLSVKGFTWDIANGAANPTDANLAVSTNWDKKVSSHKDGPGIRITVE